ncbi:MAG: ABC transporter permease subunit, partial [Actinomycetes bacterium]
QALVAAGTTPTAALLHGLLPLAAGDLLSYAFYRLECSVRSAVVLGMLGAGGLGFQLELSFSALRYREMWTVIAALVALGALVDLAGSGLRVRLARPRRGSGPYRSAAAALGTFLALTAWSWAYVDVRPGTLTRADTRAEGSRLVAALWPPATDPATLADLARLSVQTFQMSFLAAVLALAAGLACGTLAVRVPDAGWLRRLAGGTVRLLLLTARAVPPPVWALLALFVLYPGLAPGAVALAAYNAGVLGRLTAEVQESLSRTPEQSLRALGAGPVAAWSYGVLPRALPKDLAYGLYRWEVAARETVIVGLVGAGGLGQLLATGIAAFDWPLVSSVLLALVALTLVVDLLSSWARRVCR